MLTVAETFIIFFGQDPLLAGLAQGYINIALWATLPSLAFLVLVQVLGNEW